MMTVRQASFRRMLERGDRRYAEVEVETDHRAAPRLFAYFRLEGNGHYQLVRVISGDSEAEDDGSVGVGGYRLTASADEDAAARLFAGPSHGGEEDRADFGKRVLAFGDVRGQLDIHMKGAIGDGR